MRLLTSVTLAICLFVFCNQSSSNNEDTSEMTLSTYTSIQAQQGKALYQKSCIACRGAKSRVFRSPLTRLTVDSHRRALPHALSRSYV